MVGSQETQTDLRPAEEEYTISIMKEKEETLGKLNIIKETKIQRLEGYNSKLKNHLRNTFEELDIDIREEDIDLFLKKIEVIDRSEIRRRISNVAENLAQKNFMIPIRQEQALSSISSSNHHTPVMEERSSNSNSRSQSVIFKKPLANLGLEARVI